MRIIVCLDDKGGMMFNHRRQSRDREVIADILKMTDGEKLYIDQYSQMLFDGAEGEYELNAQMLDIAEDTDFCFVENKDISCYADRIRQLIIYRWNRRYPADLFFGIDLVSSGFKCVSTEEFAGYSHEKITKEIFVR